MPAIDAPPTRPAELAGRRVLLVDDHRMLRESLRRALGDEGIDVVAEAADGLEGVALAAAHRPDVVLMDVTMPILDGLEATRRLSAELPGLPVILLTMHAEATLLRDARAAGAAGYVEKGGSIDDVLDAIAEALDPGRHLSAGLALAMLERRTDGDAEILSPREIEVLEAIVDGASTPEVAAQLFISQKTVKNHLASIYAKLDARDRTQAVLAAVRRGIIRL